MVPFVKSMYWFPDHYIDERALRANFEIELEDMEGEYSVRVYRIKRFAGERWIGMPRGMPELVEDTLKNRKYIKDILDLRAEPKAKMKLEMHGEYRDYQIPAIEDLINSENGVIQMPPRMGKTVIGIGAIGELGLKALIIAHQTDLIEQFCEETIYDPKLFKGRRKPPVAGICSKYEDFVKYPVCLATYQTFLSDKGQKLLNRIKYMFGITLTDEVHRLPADRYTMIMSRFSAKYMWGLTGTSRRKDGKYVLAEMIVGPVVHDSGKHRVLKPKLYAHMTPLKVGNRKPPNHWTYFVNYVSMNIARNKYIANMAVKDVERGHVVLIPIARKEQADTLENLINGQYGDKICFKFTGDIPKKDRQKVRDRMNDDPSIKVVLAMRSMLLGMNVPRWSCLYTVAHISNEPTYTQEVFRICTPMEGKRRPIIRYFFDAALGRSYGCFRTCCETLLNRENGFEVTQSFEKLLSYVSGTPSKGKRDIDDISTFKPYHGRENDLQGIKYL